MSIDLILRFLAVAAAAYVLGSVPFAFIWTLVIARRDLRRLGTGNITVFNSFQNAGTASGSDDRGFQRRPWVRRGVYVNADRAG